MASQAAHFTAVSLSTAGVQSVVKVTLDSYFLLCVLAQKKYFWHQIRHVLQNMSTDVEEIRSIQHKTPEVCSIRVRL